MNETSGHNTITPFSQTFHLLNEDIQPGTNKEKKKKFKCITVSSGFTKWPTVLDEGQGFWEQSISAVAQTLEVWVNKTKQTNSTVL